MSENKPLPGHIGFGFGTPVRVSKFLPEDCIYVASEGTLKKALLTMNTVAEQEIEIAALRAENEALKGEVERMKCCDAPGPVIGCDCLRCMEANTRTAILAKYAAEAALESLRGEVREVVSRIGYYSDAPDVCQECAGRPAHHAPDCRLAALLKRVGA